MKNSEVGQVDSLNKRYAFKVVTNICGFIINILMSLIVPRGLGPRTYGDYNFLTNFFSQLLAFFEMGTSTAYYTKLSQRQGDTDLVKFYGLCVVLISLAVILFVIIASGSLFRNIIWPDQEVFFICLAAGLGIVLWLSNILNQMMDAYGLTVDGEKVKLVQKGFGLVLLAFLFFTQLLDLKTYFIFNYIVWIGLCLSFFWFIRKKFHSLLNGYRTLSWETLRNYTKEFYLFSHPLFVLSLIGFIANIFDRWLLQYVSGSSQQGFYGLSYQVGALCFLFTGAMSPLIAREFAIAFDKDDLNHMRYLFRRYIPLLYVISAYFACFIAVQADKVIWFMGGNAYREALMAVAIMSFYPIHQTYGQLTGSVFLAAGKTSLYRNLGISFLLAGIPLTYIFIAPTERMGLDAGATGLACKMVIVNVLSVNVALYFAARILSLNFWEYLGHQILVIATMVIMAFISVYTVDHWLVLGNKLFCSFIIAGIIYSAGLAGFAFAYPRLFGLQRNDIQRLLDITESFLKSKKRGR